MNRSVFMTALPFLLLQLLVSNPAESRAPDFELTLSQAILGAKQTSERLKAAATDEMAAREREDFAFTALLPRLTLDGIFRYVTTVPALPVPVPGLGNIPLGSNPNYNIGPTLSYSLWDSGAARNSYQGQIKLTKSRVETQKNITSQLVGSVKMAYVNVQLGLEQLNLVRDTLGLSRAQDKDITHRFNAGSATRLDLLTAHREVLNYELQFKQQRANLTSALRDLLALVGSTASQQIPLPSDPSALKLDSLESTLEFESNDEPEHPDDDSPQLKSQEYFVQSLELVSKSLAAGAYPQLQISARTSLDYPNGPILETINQNTFFASLTFPLFEFDRTHHLAAEKANEAESARHRMNQLRTDQNRDFFKAKELLSSLREQKKDSEESARQSEILAKLSYESYRFGRINLVDVQVANVRSLQAKVDLARINAQILAQLIALKTLSGKES